MPDTTALQGASVPRRIGASCYDLLVVIALWMFVYYPLVALGVVGGTTADSFSPFHWLLRAAIAFAYFGRSWTRGGRTLGMMAWKLRIRRDDGAALGWADARARFSVALGYLVPLAVVELVAPNTQSYAAFYGALLAPFLLGIGWSAFDAEGRALHEKVLTSRAVRSA